MAQVEPARIIGRFVVRFFVSKNGSIALLGRASVRKPKARFRVSLVPYGKSLVAGVPTRRLKTPGEGAGNEPNEPGTFTLGYSPHAWGMGGGLLEPTVERAVFPTRVGDGGRD